jgi:uncharacterized protein DUF29
MAVQTQRMPLHELDETAWLEKTARLVRQGKYETIDRNALAQYLLDMAIRDRREVFSRLVTLMIHLLKWAHQPEKRSRSWEDTIANERQELEQLFKSKTLRNHADTILEEAFAYAPKRAAGQTKLKREVFPSECPYTVDELLAE